MKSLLKSFCFVFIIFYLLPFMAFCQNKESDDKADNKLVSAAKEIMNGTPTCALISLDNQGRPVARAMDAFAPEADMSVWFGTNPKSRKVSQIKKDPNVSLYYVKSDASGYILIQGIAQIVDDQKKKEKYWKNEWTAFYPNYPDDFLLIKVSPLRMEVVSYTHGITGDSVTWETPHMEFKPAGKLK